ncbi:MAG: peptide chain release factor 2 [Patescibacteria group bacterium]|nr:peptide chain release factor 2 [Patescibacteria group bacterium]
MINITDLQNRILSAKEQLFFEDKQKRIAKLEELTQAADFWNDQKKAQQIFDELKELQKMVKTWHELEKEANDLAFLAKNLDDSIKFEWEQNAADLSKNIQKAEEDIFLCNKYDRQPAIVSFWAGTGGTDAQDWTAMLLRMYLRFCERMGWKVELIHEQPGDEAGLKSASIEIHGANVYGYLRRERGTHRLIRLSPFNAKNLRQTSFAGVEAIPLIDKVAEIEILEKDVKIDTYRSSGAGGQHVNKTDSAVRITHMPTNIVVACQSARSQLQNKQKAWQILTCKLLAKKLNDEEKELKKTRGEAFSADFGGQIRTVTLHPYQQVKDHRTGFEVSNTEKYLDGDIMLFIDSAMREGF